MAAEIALAPAEGLSVVWDRGAVLAYAQGGGVEPAWYLDGSLEPEYAALRVLSGSTGDGRLLLLAAARPAAADGHDDEGVAAVVVGADDARKPVTEALVSTEYAADGTIRRVGLELYTEGDDYPIRGAGDAVTASTSAGLRTAELRFRLDGTEGVALYEIVEPE